MRYLPPPRAPAGTRRFTPSGILILAVLLLAPAVWTATQRHPQVGTNVLPTPPEEKPADTQLKDLELHVEHLRMKLEKTSERAHEAQLLIRKAAPFLDRHFLQEQKRRLEGADAHLERVRRETEEALEELRMIEDSFERSHQ